MLKHAVADLVPPEVLHRRKHGFSLPLDSWFRNELRNYLEARLLASSARVPHASRVRRLTGWSVSTCPVLLTMGTRSGRW